MAISIREVRWAQAKGKPEPTRALRRMRRDKGSVGLSLCIDELDFDLLVANEAQQRTHDGSGLVSGYVEDSNFEARVRNLCQSFFESIGLDVDSFRRNHAPSDVVDIALLDIDFSVQNSGLGKGDADMVVESGNGGFIQLGKVDTGTNLPDNDVKNLGFANLHAEQAPGLGRCDDDLDLGDCGVQLLEGAKAFDEVVPPLDGGLILPHEKVTGIDAGGQQKFKCKDREKDDDGGYDRPADQGGHV